MKKKLLIVALAAVILIGTFFIGNKIGASGDWTILVRSEAVKDFKATGDSKTEELRKNDISDQMKLVLDPKIKEEQAELERMLEEYYQLKLSRMENTPEFIALETEIENLRAGLFGTYKAQIDAMFTSAK